jgi:hypothetical protein
MKQLQQVALTRSRVTDAGERKLKQLLPSCRIER